MKCQFCGRDNADENDIFCPYCGGKYGITCPSCKQEGLPSTAKFCPKCGASLIQDNVHLNSRPDSNSPIAECGGGIPVGSHKVVDLGLKVLWSSCNIGSQNICDNGLDFSWGDPTRKTITSKIANWFTSAPPLNDICGSKYDMAKAHWGWKWRLPQCEDIVELLANSCWSLVNYNGHDFYQVISKINGNYILFPLSIRLWVGDHAYGGEVHFLDTSEGLCSEPFNIDHLYYVRAVIDK